MKDLENIEDCNTFKDDNFSVLMIWAEGCGVCQEAKPQFEALESKFDYKFYKMKMSEEAYKFYEQYEEKEPVRKPAVDEDGDPILDARGTQMTQIVRDDKGEIVKRAPISVPKYYVFHGEEATEDNEYGLLGKIDGHNLAQLEAILDQISQLEVEDSTEHSQGDSKASEEQSEANNG
jgi:thiol-disulfide isomerase/thioredoxin